MRIKEANPKFIVIDLFCGAGGTTTGMKMAVNKEGRLVYVAAAVNHDPIALVSHWRNSPEVEHFEEDITKLYGYDWSGVFFRSSEFVRLQRLINTYRAFYPKAKIILWASLECTNFSKAKGGMPRDADSRTLADHLRYYIIGLNPDYIQIENVVEFQSWGPLDEFGKPISRKNGKDWMRWKESICAMGYRDDWAELNSANFGAYTSRNRLFGCFAKPGLPIVWPEATHAKNPGKSSLFNNLAPWKPVKDVLDFSDEGQSIFTRKKPLSEKTLERIYAGLIKYVAGGKDKFMLKYNSTSKDGVHYPPSVDDPCPTIACQNRLGMVHAAFITKYYSGKPEGKNIPVTGPAGTVTCVDGQALVQTQFITQRNSGNPDSKIVSVDGPARTLTGTGGNQDLVQADFLTSYYGNGGNTSSDEPSPTLTTKDRLAIVQTHFINRDFTNGGESSSIDAPAGSVMPNPKLNLVQVDTSFVMSTNYDNKPTSLQDPVGTITANRKWHYLVNPSWGGHSTSTDDPSPVIVARQDKAPMYLVVTEQGELGIVIYDTDSACMKKIKEFMAMYGIVDIKMRMLKVMELLKIQGFPDDYVLEGNQTDQKKFIGNSVVPIIPKVWMEALAMSINQHQLAA